MPLSNHTPLQDQANSTYVNIPGFLWFEWPANLPAKVSVARCPWTGAGFFIAACLMILILGLSDCIDSQ